MTEIKIKIENTLRKIHNTSFHIFPSTKHTPNANMPCRVLAALQSSTLRQRLKSKLPKGIKCPDLVSKYPLVLLKALPRTYIDLGILTEALLRYDTIDGALVKRLCVDLFSVELEDRIFKVKSTETYITSVAETREKLMAITTDCFQYDKELGQDGCDIVGHPDIYTSDDIFEIKTSCKLKDSWTMFLLQAFCYAALSNAQHVHIVLPLQNHIESYDLSSWRTRADYLNIMKDYNAPNADAGLAGRVLVHQFKIGTHVAKKGKVSTTVSKLIPDVPFQLFLSMSSKIEVSDDDIAETRRSVDSKRLRVYVHAPYILNLCDDKDYIIETLVKILDVSHACGFKGVVVHVGKSVKRPLQEALTNMKNNIQEILKQSAGTLILETPAGQGTEVLTDCASFMEFVSGIPRLKVCMDTCHVYAAGSMPYTYLESILQNAEWKARLALIHFNDSETDFNSKIDRHAAIGRGKIPFEVLLHCAQLGYANGIDMLVE